MCNGKRISSFINHSIIWSFKCLYCRYLKLCWDLWNGKKKIFSFNLTAVCEKQLRCLRDLTRDFSIQRDYLSVWFPWRPLFLLNESAKTNPGVFDRWPWIPNQARNFFKRLSQPGYIHTWRVADLKKGPLFGKWWAFLCREQKLAVIVTTVIKRSGDNGPCSHWTRLDRSERKRGEKIKRYPHHIAFNIVAYDDQYCFHLNLDQRSQSRCLHVGLTHVVIPLVAVPPRTPP